jgi:hypothetical protein
MTSSNRLREFFGEIVIEALRTAPTITRHEVVYDESAAEDTIEGRLVRGGSPLSPQQVEELRSALLDDATFVWDHATRHRDFPHHVFEVLGEHGSCAVFVDIRGLKVRVAHGGRHDVRDLAEGSAGLASQARLARS